MGAELFEAKAGQDVGNVEIEEAGQFNVPEGTEDSDIFEYLNSRTSDYNYVETAVGGLRRKVQELNTKLEGVTGPDYFDQDSTDVKEAEVLAKKVQTRLDELGSNFLARLGELEAPGEYGRSTYDETKGKLIQSMVTDEIEKFIKKELIDYVASAEDSEGREYKFDEALAERQPEKMRKKERQDAETKEREALARGDVPESAQEYVDALNKKFSSDPDLLVQLIDHVLYGPGAPEDSLNFKKRFEELKGTKSTLIAAITPDNARGVVLRNKKKILGGDQEVASR